MADREYWCQTIDQPVKPLCKLRTFTPLLDDQPRSLDGYDYSCRDIKANYSTIIEQYRQRNSCAEIETGGNQDKYFNEFVSQLDSFLKHCPHCNQCHREIQ